MLKILFFLFLISVPAFANTLTANKVVMTASSSPGISPTTEDSDITDILGTSVTVGVPLTLTGNTEIGTVNSVSGKDLYTNAWADYSSTSTIVGWTNFTIKTIRYKKIGKFVYVQYNLTGTSNSTSSSFTLPYPTDSNTPTSLGYSGSVDNGGSQSTGVWNIPGSSSSTINLYFTSNGGTWTASGTKSCIGEFFYQST